MMRKSRQHFFRKKQYIYLIATLQDHGSEGLTLHELTYLLTTRPFMNKMSMLEKKFKDIQRKDVFKSRQRIHDCLTTLKDMNMTTKEEEKYYINTMVCYHLLKYEKQIQELEIQINKIHENSDLIEEEIRRDPYYKEYNKKHMYMQKDGNTLLKELINDYEKTNQKT